MFRYEKDMIPILKEHLSTMFNTNYFVEEFSTGIGIADLVFTQNIEARTTSINDFESISYILNNINSNKSKKISIEDRLNTNKLSKAKFLKLISFLEELECISIMDNNIIKVKKQYKPRTDELYSIEAKLRDWRGGLYQALRYKNYSHKCYLAISQSYLRLVDIELLKLNNVGLISVSNDSIEIILKPKKENPINKIAQFYLSENFVSKIN
jgi:hypothetical protein